jgi:hypothetical protein
MGRMIVVVDGMGGGIGAQLLARIRKDMQADAALVALATNAVAVQRMVDAGAARGASGENAFRVVLPDADFIVGPLGIALPNAMMGEVTTAMAESVLAARGKKILLPLVQSHVYLVGLAQGSVGDLVEQAVQELQRELEGS